MLLYFAKNPWVRNFGIFYHNRYAIITMGVLAGGVYYLYHVIGVTAIALPVAPVSIIGVGLAIFLGFRNSSAYDRWWEARKIWGGIVNYSRTWGMEITSFI